MPPRSNSFAKLLTSSTATSSALLALQHSAGAAIIYTNPTDYVLHSNESVHLFLRGGGTDFRIGLFTSGAGTSLKAEGEGVRGNQFANTNLYIAKKLAANTPIGPAAGAWNSFGNLRSANMSGRRTGEFLPGQTGLAGIRLDVGGGSYDYGWIRLRVDDEDSDGLPDKITVFDYAYNDTSDAPINAGQTSDLDSSVPETGNTALLALAGCGAATLVRRRQAA